MARMLDDIENAGDKSGEGRLLKKPAVCHAKNERLEVISLKSLKGPQWIRTFPRRWIIGKEVMLPDVQER
jgi:hypothetical protein